MQTSGDAEGSSRIAEAESFARDFPSGSLHKSLRASTPALRSPTEASEPPHQPQSDAKTPEGKEPRKRKTYQQVQMPSPEQIMQEDFMNHCVVRTILSGVMGMGLGAVFGIAMGTFDTAGAGLDGNPEVTKQTTRQVIREMVKKTSRNSWSYGKTFGAMGALFAGSECVIEKTRAKHDMYNSIYAGPKHLGPKQILQRDEQFGFLAGHESLQSIA